MGMKQDRVELRRTRVRQMMEQGIDPKEIAQRLGWSASAVYADLRHMGMARDDRLEDRRRQVHELRQRGMSVVDVAMTLGITESQASDDSAATRHLRTDHAARNGANGNRTAQADITRILQIFEPLGPALYEAIKRLEEDGLPVPPDVLLDWRKVVDDYYNISKCFTHLRRYLKEHTPR